MTRGSNSTAGTPKRGEYFLESYYRHDFPHFTDKETDEWRDYLKSKWQSPNRNAGNSVTEAVCFPFMLHISFGLKYRLNLIKNAIPVSDFHGLVDRREFDHIKIVDNIIKSRKKF